MTDVGEVIDSPTIRARRDQIFITLSEAEMDAVRRFGEERSYPDGAVLYETGKPSPGALFVVSGAIVLTGRDAHGNSLPVVVYQKGQFAGEVGQLSGARALVDAKARGALTAILVPAESLRRLLIAEASLGEKLVRAFTLRRVAMIESGFGGPLLVGDRRSPDMLRLQNFLRRNGIPYQILDPADDAEARTIAEPYAPHDFPLAVCPDGSVLKNPREFDIGRCLGMLDGPRGVRYDVVVVGAGPAGLSTAVYAASEGLAVAVVDARSFGGQAGASMRIENYLGFPTGISGQALAGRAFVQAQKFGARVLIPTEVEKLDCSTCHEMGAFTLHLTGGETLRTRTVVVASGARYRRPDHPELLEMEGRGVWYWASPVEAAACATEEVALVGGGNSAGQAAVYLAGNARRVWLLVRGKSLAASMSSYLIERIRAMPNIELLTETEIYSLQKDEHGRIASVTWCDKTSGKTTTQPVHNIFLFLGADPATEWLRGCGAKTDAKGFVLTGAAAGEGLQPLESSIRGLFAVGDVRAGSVKRVGAAIGEGATAVSQIHTLLGAESTTA